MLDLGMRQSIKVAEIVSSYFRSILPDRMIDISVVYQMGAKL